MNVVFLDYDGVVNTPQWRFNEGENRWVCTYAYPSMNTVNDFQAVQWVSEFCQKYDYKIVVTSTWRFRENYKECLINGGLRKEIEIIDKTPRFMSTKFSRGDEISAWLREHPEVESYLIFDDDTDMGPHGDHLIHCDSCRGFKMDEFEQAKRIHNIFQEGRDSR